MPEVEEGHREHPAAERRLGESLGEGPGREVPPGLVAQHALQGPHGEHLLVPADRGAGEPPLGPGDHGRGSVVGGGELAYRAVHALE